MVTSMQAVQHAFEDNNNKDNNNEDNNNKYNKKNN